MGYIKHHAIVVTGSSGEIFARESQDIETAHKEAERIFGELVSPVVESAVNGYKSFLVIPDGSKEGWDESDAGDDRRAEYIQWLEEHAYEDGSSSLKWAELFYGEDNGFAQVTRHN